jgi:hypothetical protein
MRKSIIALITILFLYPSISAIADASLMTQENQVFSQILFNQANSEYYTKTIELGNTSSIDYNNFNYTNMSEPFNVNGKYIYPLTPPIKVLWPYTLADITYSSIFTLQETIFDGISEAWIRLPFTMENETYYEIELHKLDQSNNNLSSMTHDATRLDFEYSSTCIYDKNFYYSHQQIDYKYQNITTTDGITYKFTWLRVNAPITALDTYSIKIRAHATTAKTVYIYPTAGDTYADGEYNTWINTTYNDTLYLNLDLDTTIFMTNTLHNGITSETARWMGYTEDRQRYAITLDDQSILAGITGTGKYLNILMPANIENNGGQTVYMNTSITYTDASHTSSYISFTDRYNETYLNDNIALATGKITEHVSITVDTDANITIFMTTDYNDADTYKTTIIKRGSSEYNMTSTCAPYGYFSIDTFTIDKTQYDVMLIPFNSGPSDQASIGLIRYTYFMIMIRDEQNIVMQSVSLVLQTGLETALAISTLPIKAIDLAIEYGGELMNQLDYLLSGTLIGNALDFFNSMIDGINNMIGYFIEILELVMPYFIYGAYMMAKFIGVFMGIAIGMIVINTADATTKGLIDKNLAERLSIEWKSTTRIFTILLLILGYIFQLIMGMVQEVLPL